MGPNGSGKSTLLKLISGIHQPTSGNIFIDHNPLAILDFQAGINKSGSGIDNIFLVSYLIGVSKHNIKENLNKIIEYSELEDFIHLPLSTYSSGMIARLTTSIALFSKSKILVMDEYFGTLDKHFREKVFKSFLDQLTYVDLFILASHDPTLIMNTCNRIISLQNGKVVNDKRI